MVDYHEVFNKKLIEFVDDLVSSFNGLEDFVVYKNLLNACVLVDKTAPQVMFHQTVVIPYEQHIKEKNESFLLNETYNVGVDQGIVDKLKGIWKSLDTENKDVIWKYMQVLVVLNKKCQG